MTTPDTPLLGLFRTEIVNQITPDMRRRARRRLHAKTIFILVWMAVSYQQLLFGHHGWVWAALMLLSLSLAASGAAMAVMHDGNHGAFSRYKWLNHLSGLVLDLLGSSSALWCIKHNKAHHSAPNWEEHDTDIAQEPFARLAPHQRWRPYHRYQHRYMWVLYCFLVIKSPFGDLINLKVGRIGAFSLRGRFSWWQWTELVLGKCIFVAWVFIVPSLLYSFWKVLLCYLVAAGLLGFLLAVTFQLAHCVDNADFVGPDQRPGDWLTSQFDSTVDIRSGNRLGQIIMGFLFGGLDHQVEHHCQPSLPHTMYRSMEADMAAFCARHGLTYRYHPTVWAALMSHQRWLREMGKPPISATAS